MAKTASQPGLCLIAEARSGGAWVARVEAALDATSASTLVLTGTDGNPIDHAAARLLVEAAHKKNVAALLADDVAGAKATGADGVHLSWRPEIEDAYEAARSALGAEAIVGADAGASRHDAMTLGETGVDYIAFSPMTDAYGTDEARETQHELVTWWSEIFLVPVVAFGAETTGDVAELSRVGADFVAVRLPDAASDDKAWAAGLVAALSGTANAA